MPRKPKPRIDIADVRGRLLAVEKQLTSTFVQRDEAVRVILLGVLAQQNYLLVGPPGTAKTSVIDCFTKHIDAKVRFKILMGKFTQPDDVFGSLDIAAFKEGRREVVTTGMFTEAPLPILDEALKASDGCMNSLLGVLGPEREFRKERTQVICTGAATNWPEVDALSAHVEALYDRFLLRCTVNAVDRSNKLLRRKLYHASRNVETYTPDTVVSVEELRVVADDVLEVEVTDLVIDMLDALIARLMAPKGTGSTKRPSDIEISDRRAVQLQRVLQANAWLEGRDHVSIEDFEVLRHGLWSKRKDLESVNTALDGLDDAAVKEITDMTAVGQAAYRQLQAEGFGVAKINKVIDEIRKIVNEVHARLEQPIFTKRGRKKIKVAVAALRKDFVSLDAKAKGQAGGWLL